MFLLVSGNPALLWGPCIQLCHVCRGSLKTCNTWALVCSAAGCGGCKSVHNRWCDPASAVGLRCCSSHTKGPLQMSSHGVHKPAGRLRRHRDMNPCSLPCPWHRYLWVVVTSPRAALPALWPSVLQVRPPAPRGGARSPCPSWWGSVLLPFLGSFAV